MSHPDRPETIPDDPVRSHARGGRFWTVILGAWPICLVLGVIVGRVSGLGLAIGIGSGLAVALGINFVWAVVMLAVDDGDVDDHVHETLRRSEPRSPAG
jgi:hypothetical protein